MAPTRSSSALLALCAVSVLISSPRALAGDDSSPSPHEVHEAGAPCPHKEVVQNFNMPRVSITAFQANKGAGDDHLRNDVYKVGYQVSKFEVSFKM